MRMPSNNSKYTPEFRAETAKYVIESGKSSTSVAEEIGIDKKPFFNYPASYGRVTTLYSVSGSGGYPIAVGGGEVVSSSGEIAAVKYLMIDMSGGYNIGYAYEKLSFNATSKTASLTTLPLY